MVPNKKKYLFYTLTKILETIMDLNITYFYKNMKNHGITRLQKFSCFEIVDIIDVNKFKNSFNYKFSVHKSLSFVKNRTESLTTRDHHRGAFPTPTR